jgi:hypothetical protein
MRRKDIGGIVNDLIELRCWWNPARMFWIEERIVFDLLTGVSNGLPTSTLHKLMRAKRDWFLRRVRSLDGDLEDFERAEIVVYGMKEVVSLVYGGELFEKEFCA